MSLLDEIYESEHLICKGLKEINDKGELNKETLSMMGDLIDMAKDYFEVTMRAEYPEYDYSRGRDDYSMGRYSLGDHEQSYARRRDSMGRYSRGYSRGNDTISKLEEKMHNARNEEEREKYHRMIIELENM